MEKSNKVLVLSSIVLVGFTLSIIYHYAMGAYLSMDSQYSSFLYPAQAAFCDFYGSFPDIRDFAPYQNITLWVIYFPFTYILLFPFAVMKNQVLSYVIFASGFLFYLIFMNIKIFSCEKFNKLQNFQNIFILTVLSYPVLYIFDKGNLDMYLVIVLSLFAYAFKKEKYLLSSVLLGLSNAIKPFTFLFLFLLLFKKQYKNFFLSIIITTLLTVGSFMLFKNNFFDQIDYLLRSFMFFKQRYMLQNANDFGMAYASSLFMVFKLVLCKSTAVPLISTVALAKWYDHLCSIITIITMYFVWREKSFWKQLTLLICNFLLLPAITYDYKLMFLYIPIWLFTIDKEKTNFDMAYVILFGLLLIPKHILIALPYSSQTMASWFSLSIILNPLIMIVLTLLIIYEQFLKKKKVEKEV